MCERVGALTRATVTTGNPAFAVCRSICRGPNIGHTAKVGFAVCHEKSHTAKIQFTAKQTYAVCQAKRRTAKVCHTANHTFCRVPKVRHTAKVAARDAVWPTVSFAVYLELNAKTNTKLKLPSQRHTFWGRSQTSHQNNMLTIFLACITHLLVTMLGKMTRTSIFSEVNSEVQV